MRVLLVAVALSAVSFVAGIAGDLSRPANSGAAVTLRIPPPIPADAPRARPIISTPAAEAAEPALRRAAPVDKSEAEEAEAPVSAKPRQNRLLRMTKAKHDVRLAAQELSVKAA